MRLLPSRVQAPPPVGPSGTVRLDRDTGALTLRLRRGDIAVVDHLDLDAATAARLVACGPAAVVNVAPSSSGRHPTGGAAALLAAGVPLLDAVGPEVFAGLREGQTAVLDLDAGMLLRTERGGRSTAVAQGTLATSATVAAAADSARAGLLVRLEGLVGDTVETLWREPELILDGPAASLQWASPAAGRPVLLVLPHPGTEQALHLLARWIRRTRPLVVALDDGVVLAQEAGLDVDLLALTGAGEEPEHGDIRAGGAVLALGAVAAARAEDAGVPAEWLEAALPATATVLALLAAAEPDLLVQTAPLGDLHDLLDLDRAEGGAALLLRVRTGGLLVDAGTVAALDGRRPLGAAGSRRARRRAARATRRLRRTPGVRGAWLVLLAGLVCALAVAAVSDPGRALLHRWGVSGP